MKQFPQMVEKPVHEGHKIRALLEAAGKRPADLARAIGVTQTSVGRYLDAERMGAKAWESASRGLSTLGIDPWQVRPLEIHGGRIARERPDELRQMLVGFGKRQLEQLLKILEAPPETHYVLRVIISDRMNRGGAE